jgi:hypothetical protein
MNREAIVKLTLRIALVWGLLYPACSAFIHPIDWIGFFPHFLRGHFIPDAVLLGISSIVDILLAAWFVYGRYLFIPSAFSTLWFGLIFLFNFNLLELNYANLSLAIISLALAFWTYPRVLSKPLGK